MSSTSQNAIQPTRELPTRQRLLVTRVLTGSDDWAGKGNPKERRRIQNRLNQRAARQRKDPEKWTPLRARLHDIARGHQTFPSEPPCRSKPELSYSSTGQHALMDVAHRIESDDQPQVSQKISHSLEILLPLSADHLITLVQHNVYRGFLTNMLLLNLPNIFTCEIKSHRCDVILPLPFPNLVPPSLRPTLLQQSTPHEPWIDLFPLPALRDHLIRIDYDSCELCEDILGSLVEKNFIGRRPKQASDSVETSETGLILWGDPWNLSSWELSAGFVRKYGWIFQDYSDEMLRATNHWRRIRGEEALQLEYIAPDS